MKKSEINKEIKELTTADLVDKIANEQMELTKLKMTHSLSPLENPMQIRAKRKYIARLLNEQRSREIKNVQ